MRVALLNSATPFVRGGAEILVDDLTEQLMLRGHSVQLYRLPFPNNYEQPLISTILAAQSLRLESYDRVISFKFPAYCIRHRSSAFWIFHQFRQVYELWDKEYGLKDTSDARAIRDLVREADRQAFSSARHVYTNAREVSNRLKTYNGFDSAVLPPPLKNVGEYHCGDTTDYIFYPSRITNLKRQHLAVEAMRHTKSKVRLYVVGRCTEPEYDQTIKELIRKYNLHDKVVYRNEWISDTEKIKLIADSLGMIYIPYKEDSCGFVTMEAFYASKPTISCTDSGGTYELITDGQNGLFAEPDPKSLARAMDALYEDKMTAVRMGEDGYREIVARNITWDETIRKLLL